MVLKRLGFVESYTLAVARTASSRYDAAKALLVPQHLRGCVRVAEAAVVVCAAPVLACVTSVSQRLLIEADTKVNIVLSTGGVLLDLAHDDSTAQLTVAKYKDRSTEALYLASEFVKANGVLSMTGIALSSSARLLKGSSISMIDPRRGAATKMLRTVSKLGFKAVLKATLFPARTATAAAGATFKGIVQLTKAAIGLEMAGVRAAIALRKTGVKTGIALGTAGVKAATALGVAGGKVLGAAAAHSLRMQWSVVRNSAKISLATAKFAASAPIQGPKAAIAAAKWLATLMLATALADARHIKTTLHISVPSTYSALFVGVRGILGNARFSAAGPGSTAVLPRRSRHIMKWDAVYLMILDPEFVWLLLRLILLM